MPRDLVRAFFWERSDAVAAITTELDHSRYRL